MPLLSVKGANRTKGNMGNICSDQNFGFEIQSGTLVKYTGTATDVVIPETVVSIGERAFENLSIASVTIPHCVKTIGIEAFKGCKSLHTITCDRRTGQLLICQSQRQA